MFIDGFSLIDGIYQAGITFTTVGFGEISPISNAGRIFTITLIVLGFGVFSFSIGILVEVLNKGELVRTIKERNMLYRVARLKRHFVICYHNVNTMELAKQFRENQIPFVVIDPSEDFEKIAIENKYPYYIKAEPHTEEALKKSNLSSAQGVITLSQNIADNIAQIASVRLYEKELGRRPYFILSYSKSETDTEKLKKLGADRVVSSSKLMAQRIASMSIRPEMENILEEFLYRKDIPIDIEEIFVPERSWIRFKKLKQAHLRDITGVSVVGIKEENGRFIAMPKGDTMIGSGCKLLVVGTSEGIMSTKKIIGKKTRPTEINYV